MCLVLLAQQTIANYPLVLAANRDEFHARAAAPLHWWPDAPSIAAGRDRVAGGTWLGAAPSGRFATVLNAPDREAPSAARSRGELVPGFLQAGDPEGEIRAIHARRSLYGGFHFVAGTPGGAWYVSSGDARPVRLEAGIHAADNAGLDPGDARVGRALAGFERACADPGVEPLLELLADTAEPAGTPAGGGDGRPVFIRGERFGTRCSSVLRIDRSGGVELFERRFDAHGDRLGDTCLRWSLEADAAEAG